MKKIFFLVVLSVMAIFSLTSSKINDKRPQKLSIKIIETTDVHGYILPYDFIDNKATEYSLSHVSGMLNKLRTDPAFEYILLDNGDILQGQPSAYYSNFMDTASTHLVAAAMNYMKYDAGSVGNHDIETGHAVYDRFNKQLNFPWLAANALRTDNGEPYFKPYTIIERKGVKIAVLGLTTPGIPNWLPEVIYKGIVFEDMIVTAQKWVKIIQEKEKPDAIVGLFHAGIDPTYGGAKADEFRNENAVMLVAKQVPGFNVVFAGHDHSAMNEKIINAAGEEVLVMNAGSRGEYAAIAQLNFELNKKTKAYKITSVGELMASKNFEPDRELTEHLKKYSENVLNYTGAEVAVITEALSSREAIFGNAKFVDLLNSVQLDLSGAQISFAAPLSFNAEIAKGKLLVNDMFKIYKFENLLYTIELSGKEIKGYLEFSYSIWFNEMKSENDALLLYKKDASGKITNRLANAFYNYDEAAGIIYTIDLSKPYGERITIKSLADGTPFSEAAKYKVAVNSYRGNGGGDHLTKGAGIAKAEITGRILKSTEIDLRYYIMEYLKKNSPITPKALNNRTFVPEIWYRQAKEREFNILFPNK